MDERVKLGVFITTHIVKPENSHHRHGPGMMENAFGRFKNLTMGGYLRHLPRNVFPRIHICDTGCDCPELEAEIKEYYRKYGWIERIKIPNKCGAFAALKYVMHESRPLRDQFDYYLFHVDDGTHIVEESWADDLIEKYNECPNVGVMGRLSETIRLGPAGLVDHRNVCPQVAMMWGIKHVREIPHLHADWWFMDKNTLRGMADCWYEPMHSVAGMDYQKKYEEMDFREVWELDKNRRILDNIHIGREVDMPLRIKHFMNLDTLTYTGDKIVI